MFEEFGLPTHNLVIILMMPSLKVILDVGTLKMNFQYVLKDDWKVELSQPNYI